MLIAARCDFQDQNTPMCMRPGPGKLQSFPDPLADFQGAALWQGRGGEKEKKEEDSIPHFFFLQLNHGCCECDL